MTDSYDLSKLGPDAFENIVNFLALKTLGLAVAVLAQVLTEAEMVILKERHPTQVKQNIGKVSGTSSQNFIRLTSVKTRINGLLSR